jgi:hypothetical protein
VADALSKKVVQSTSTLLSAVSVASPQWIHEVVASYQEDPESMALVAKLSIDPSAVPGLSLQHGVLRKQGRIWIGHNPSLHQKLIQACHSSALGGHSGVPATYIRMKQMFAWKGLN